MVEVHSRGLDSRRGGIVIELIVYCDGKALEYSAGW